MARFSDAMDALAHARLARLHDQALIQFSVDLAWLIWAVGLVPDTGELASIIGNPTIDLVDHADDHAEGWGALPDGVFGLFSCMARIARRSMDWHGLRRELDRIASAESAGPLVRAAFRLRVAAHVLESPQVYKVVPGSIVNTTLSQAASTDIGTAFEKQAEFDFHVSTLNSRHYLTVKLSASAFLKESDWKPPLRADLRAAKPQCSPYATHWTFVFGTPPKDQEELTRLTRIIHNLPPCAHVVGPGLVEGAMTY